MERMVNKVSVLQERYCRLYAGCTDVPYRGCCMLPASVRPALGPAALQGRKRQRNKFFQLRNECDAALLAYDMRNIRCELAFLLGAPLWLGQGGGLQTLQVRCR